MEITKHEPGMFSWADLMTADIEGSKAFYTELLSLDSVDMPMGEDAGAYVMLFKNGKTSCAMFQMGDEMKQMTGGSSLWSAYFTVDSADDTAAKAKELGATIVNGPFDVFESGRMVAIQDPTGAAFQVWQPKDNIGAQVFGEHGALGWAELYTNDTSAAAQFYSGLFGWSASTVPGGGGQDYTLFQIEDRPATGMMAIREEWGEMPPNWSIYFVVDDLDATIAKATEMGAKEVMPPMEAPGIGPFVLLQDPQGAHVFFIQMTQAQS